MIRLALLLTFALLAGCDTIRNGVDIEGHVRPAKKDGDTAPAPAPPTPPDDWAPPWFRRPKPNKPKSAMSPAPLGMLALAGNIKPIPVVRGDEEMGAEQTAEHHHPAPQPHNHPVVTVVHGLWQWFMLPVSIAGGIQLVFVLAIVLGFVYGMTKAILTFAKK